MHITLLGGAASAGFARGLAALLTADDRLTIVHNTARDMWVHGLKHCPDANAFLSDRPTSYAVADSIEALGMGPAWFRSSDQDTALDVVRTELLQADFSLAEVTAALAVRRALGAALVPMSNDRVEQHVVVDGPDGRVAIHVEEYLAAPGEHTAHDVVLVADQWSISPEADAAITSSDILMLGPDSMALTLIPIFGTPGLVEAVAAGSAPVIDARGADPAPAALASVAGNVELKFDRLIPVAAEAASAHAAARSLV